MAEYALALSEQERERYRFMAALAVEREKALWGGFGIGPGARVADVGCGPGAVLALIAEAVGPDGVAHGVDGDEQAVAAANEEVAAHAHASARHGRADATGLEAGSYDVAMCRHVLAHNGGGEQAIVDHLVSLVRPGGVVYLVDADLTGGRSVPRGLGLQALLDAYVEFQTKRGNDMQAGVSLVLWLEAAGLAVEHAEGSNRLFKVPPGFRPPAWVAREAMVAEGIITAEQVARWQSAFDAIDAGGPAPWVYMPNFAVVGRKPV